MEERRRAPRIKEENEVAIRVVSGGKNLPEEPIKDNCTKDISVSGAKIQTHILLPVNTLIELDFKSKGMQQHMKILGKIKWRKAIDENECYEFGVEFYPSKEIERLEDYISWQLKSDKSDFTPNAPPRIDSVNKRIVETIKLSPMDSGYMNIVEPPKTPPIGSGKKYIADTQKLSPMDSGYINIEENPKVSPIVSSKKNIVENPKAPPTKNHQWIIMAIISLGTIILIVVLLNIFGYLDLDFIYPHKNIKVTNNFAHVSITPKSATLPSPPIAAPEPNAEPTPSPLPAQAQAQASAPEVTKKIKVIGNSDSKMYHLPGMKYYNAVKAYHRVEFESETDAIKAGYNKAPR